MYKTLYIYSAVVGVENILMNSFFLSKPISKTTNFQSQPFHK